MNPIRLALLLCLLLPAPSLVLAADDAGYSFQGKVMGGYQIVSRDDNPVRAAEYRAIDSSPTFGLDLNAISGLHHFIFEGAYVNDKDYRGEAHFDHGGLARLELRTDRFFHNLEHIPYDPAVSEARQDAYADLDNIPGNGSPSEQLRAVFSDQNPGDDYGIRLTTDEAAFRGKFKAFPAHLNLGYWRFEKKGERQLRFVKEGHDLTPAGTPQDNGVNNCNVCHMQSRSRKVDRVTEEFKGSVDAHLGVVDLILEQVYRQFRDREPIPVDTFQGHMLRPAAQDYQHDEDPDSRLVESTVRLHTSLSGGFVAAGSFSIGERKNQSDLLGQPSGVDGVESETDYYKGAGDLTITPTPKWTLNFRYRLFDADNDNSDVVSAYDQDLANAEGRDFPVRDNIDLRRSSYEAAVAYRPHRNLTLKGRYQIEQIHRGNTGGPDQHSGFSAFFTDGLDLPVPDPGRGNIDYVWELPQDEEIQRLKVGLLARPLGNGDLKMNLWYQFTATDEPAYGTVSDDRHEAFFSSIYSPSSHWGVNVTAKASDDSMTRHEEFLFAAGGIPAPVHLDRRSEQQDVTLGVWTNPHSRLNAGVNYGFLRSRIRQDLLFGNDLGNPASTPPVASHSIEDEEVEYSQRVHTVSANAALRLTEQLNLRLEGYHIRSFAKYSPDFGFVAPSADPVFVYPASSDVLKDLTKLDIRQNGLRAGIDWSPVPVWTCSADFTYDDYEDRNSSAFDGTVQTYMVTLARAW